MKICHNYTLNIEQEAIILTFKLISFMQISDVIMTEIEVKLLFKQTPINWVLKQLIIDLIVVSVKSIVNTFAFNVLIKWLT